MSRCRVCNTNLDGEPTAEAPVERIAGEMRWWEVCLPCGVAVGGTFEGITLTPDGLAEAMANVTTAAKAVAALLSSTTDINSLLAKYRRSS